MAKRNNEFDHLIKVADVEMLHVGKLNVQTKVRFWHRVFFNLECLPGFVWFGCRIGNAFVEFQLGEPFLLDVAQFRLAVYSLCRQIFSAL